MSIETAELEESIEDIPHISSEVKPSKGSISHAFSLIREVGMKPEKDSPLNLRAHGGVYKHRASDDGGTFLTGIGVEDQKVPSG